MQPIEPELCNVIMGKDQEEYFDLPAYGEKRRTVTCWELSKEELEVIRHSGKIYVSIFNQGQKLQPVSVALNVEEVYTQEEMDAFETYASVEWDLPLDHQSMVISACPICGALPNERCHKQLINGDEATDYMYKRIHAKRLR